MSNDPKEFNHIPPRILHEILAVFLAKWGEQSDNKHGLECSKDSWRWRQIGTELTGAEHPIPNFVGFSWLPCQRTCPEWSVGGLIVSDHCLVLEGIQCLLATRKSVEPLTQFPWDLTCEEALGRRSRGSHQDWMKLFQIPLEPAYPMAFQAVSGPPASSPKWQGFGCNKFRDVQVSNRHSSYLLTFPCLALVVWMESSDEELSLFFCDKCA